VGDNRSSPSADVGLIASHVASPVLPPVSSLRKRRAVTNDGVRFSEFDAIQENVEWPLERVEISRSSWLSDPPYLANVT
jgi:hypothetical protein